MMDLRLPVINSLDRAAPLVHTHKFARDARRMSGAVLPSREDKGRLVAAGRGTSICYDSNSLVGVVMVTTPKAVALGALSLFAALLPHVSYAEPDAPVVTRKIIERAPFAHSDDELRLTVVEFPPSSSAAPHRHPVPGVCYVIDGSAETQYEGGPRKIVKAGESFQDEAGKAHLIFKNASTTGVLRFVCAAKIGKLQPYLVPLAKSAE